MSQLQTRKPARRGEHAFRRANLASEAVVARYLNDITGRRRPEHRLTSPPAVVPGARRLAA